MINNLRLSPAQQVAVFRVLALITSVLVAVSAYVSRFRLNPDGISYLSIAKQYAAGQFDTAINGWLPPMISWLTAPFIRLGIDAQQAFFFINWLTAIFILLFGMRLVWKHTKNFWATVMYWAIASPFLIEVVGRSITSDVMAVAWVLVLFSLLIWAEDQMKKYSAKNYLKVATALGVWGAIGFLTKTFLLFFFPAAIFAWTVARVWSNFGKIKGFFNRRFFDQYLRVPVLTALVFFLTMAPWILLMSAKYDTFTVSSSFSYHSENLAELPKDSKENAIPDRQLTPPPHENAVSADEDLTYQSSATDSGDKLSKRQILRNYLSERYEIMRIQFNDYNRISPMIFISTAGVLLALFLGFISYKKHKTLLISALLIGVYFFGYVAAKARLGTDVTSGEQRYQWPTLILAAIIIAETLPMLWRRVANKDVVRQTVFVLLAIAIPVSIFIRYMPSSEDLFTTPPVSPERSIVEQIKETGLIAEDSKIAGNVARPLRTMAFLLDSQSYGSIGAADFLSTDVQNKINEYDIDYYFNFTPTTEGVTLNVGSTGAERITSFYLEDYRCRDVRYGKYGAGIPPEDCTIELFKLNNNVD
ncbi:MAG: hypothetical protein R3313_01130 [Candidatus Saccharimonadales bacterium]|nr:hypothetical protein [Candidatus Saccharimonadales bacterium]